MCGGTAVESDCHRVLVGSGGALSGCEREREREREMWGGGAGRDIKDERVAATCIMSCNSNNNLLARQLLSFS